MHISVWNMAKIRTRYAKLKECILQNLQMHDCSNWYAKHFY